MTKLFMKKTLAIDFGTYNSMAVYATKDGDISIIQHEDKAAYTEKEALKTMPSFVYVNEDGKVEFVGNKAKELAPEKPGNVVWGLKRLLGKTYNTLVSDGFIEKLDFSVEPEPENGKCILCFNAKHYFRPVELISHIFNQIQIKMEMTQNKELKTTIQDIYSGEKFTYEGFKNNSSNEIDVIYPIKINTGEYKNEKHFIKEPPSQNVKVEFFLFTQGLTSLIEKNVLKYNIPKTISDYTKILRDTAKDDIDKMNAVYCLIHNASFYGLLKEAEKAEAESLALKLEQQLFKYKSLK